MERKEIIERVTPKRTMPFFGNVDADLYCSTRDHLMKMVCESPTEPITLLIDSAGGDVFHALQTVDLLRMLPVEVIGVVIEARSSAVFVLQGCSKRLIVPSGRLLIHSVQPLANAVWQMMRLDEGWEERIQRVSQMTKDYRKQTSDLICSRSGLKPEKLAEYTRRGDDPSFPYVIYAQEALESGLVDGILPSDYKLFAPKSPEKPVGEKSKETEIV